MLEVAIMLSNTTEIRYVLDKDKRSNQLSYRFRKLHPTGQIRQNLQNLCQKTSKTLYSKNHGLQDPLILQPSFFPSDLP